MGFLPPRQAWAIKLLNYKSFEIEWPPPDLEASRACGGFSVLNIQQNVRLPVSKSFPALQSRNIKLFSILLPPTPSSAPCLIARRAFLKHLFLGSFQMSYFEIYSELNVIVDLARDPIRKSSNKVFPRATISCLCCDFVFLIRALHFTSSNCILKNFFYVRINGTSHSGWHSPAWQFISVSRPGKHK
jgi:hypothetical protein